MTVMRNSPIFVVGASRSGTNLFRDLLRSHPRITFPGESHFIPLLYRAYGDPQTQRDARRLGRIILNLGWVKRWKLGLDHSSFDGCRSFRQVVTRLYEAWMCREGKQRWGDKTPHYVNEIPLLRTIFPNCQVIHVYRDGRDVALSSLAFYYGSWNLYTAARQWRCFVKRGRSAGATLPPESYFEVRYENLVTHPEETLKSVCAFLGEAFDPNVLKPNFMERFLRPVYIGQRKRTDASRTEIVASNCDKWKSGMSADDRVLFESVAGDLLAELGYETEGSTRPISSAERLRWKAHNYVRDFLERLNTRERWLQTGRLMLLAHLRYRWRRLWD